MLIVPAEYRFDAGHLPWGTLLLFLLCTLIFVLYQSDDDARTEAALSVYSGQQLPGYEQPLLQSYFEARGIAADAGQFPAAVLDRGFDAWVRDYWMTTPPAPEWQAARAQFEAARDRISWMRFGLVPADIRPASLLGHMFLHGGFAHLLGNMVFLLLFGMLLERVLGTALFVGTYIVTGLLAAGLFVLVNASSTVPLIGASGAISGLMGAYLGVYGLRRVEFFYTVGFWFGKFTAPAILVFPLWLAKELYGYFDDGSPVAYMAHAGGLLGGLLLAMLLKKQAAQVIDVDDETRRSRKSTHDRLVRIRQLMTDLHLDEAVRLAEQSIRQSPKESEYWRVYAEVAGRLALGGEYHRV
ncbi:MAG TPA: rhomboid family intramembrane serine protease, partial [Gammaproteobacteria bacterium]